MILDFYQVECGDAARISFIGSDNRPHNIFLDSGFSRTYDQILKEQIEGIIFRKEAIDLWIISHIHDDHIGGVTEYVNSIKANRIKDVVSHWLYNSPRNVTNTSTEKQSASTSTSIAQADILQSYLKSINTSLSDTVVGTADMNLHGLKITILSPLPENLTNLRKKYSDISRPIDREESLEISKSSAAKGADYNFALTSFSLGDSYNDESIENGSSISALFEYLNKKFLWLADSHPKVITNSLRNLGWSERCPLEVNLVSLSHHGSKANNNIELYKLIKCSNYVVTGNGENKFFLPSKECIARILRNPNRRSHDQYVFHFPFDNRTLRGLFRVDDPDVFEKFNFKIQLLPTGKAKQIVL